MYTSYYAKSAKHPNAISIAAKSPIWYEGASTKIVAPSWSIFSEWKTTGNNELYTLRFNSEILGKLDPEEVADTIGYDSVMLCYEKPGDFCHRHLVAKWLMSNLNINITEL